MTRNEISALLAELTAKHGPGIGFALMGAAWRAEQEDAHAEAVRTSVEEGETEEDARAGIGTVREWVAEAETELGWWLSEFTADSHFRLGAGLDEPAE